MITVRIDNSFGKELEKYIYNIQSNFPLSKISRTVQNDLRQYAINKGWVSIPNTVKRRVISKTMHEVFAGGKFKDISVYLHRGTRPHTILPKNKKVLRFFSDAMGMGLMRFAKSVKHPGTQPTNWFRIQPDTLIKVGTILINFAKNPKNAD